MNASMAARTASDMVRRQGVPVTLADGTSTVKAIRQAADDQPDSFGTDTGTDEIYTPSILWHVAGTDAGKFSRFDEFTHGGVTFRVKLITPTEAGAASTPVMVTLTTRMVLPFNQVCQLFRPVFTSINGEPQPDSLELAYDDVPCHYAQTPNLDDPATVARIKRLSFFTTDTIYFYRDQEVGNGWMTRNRTPGSLNYNEVHAIDGDPLSVYANDARAVNRKSVMAMTVEHPPAIIAALGGA